jgi:hypothetical protein
MGMQVASLFQMTGNKYESYQKERKGKCADHNRQYCVYRRHIMQSSKQEMFSRSRNNVNNIIRIKRAFLSSYSKNPSKLRYTYNMPIS